jgi:hypothetical protein
VTLLLGVSWLLPRRRKPDAPEPTVMEFGTESR